jgi:TonB family protein
MSASSFSPEISAAGRLMLAVVLSMASHAVALFAVTHSPLDWNDSGLLPGNSGPVPLQVRIVQQSPGLAAATIPPGPRPGASQPGAMAAAQHTPAPPERAPGIVLIPPSRYYRAAELDARPQIKTRVMPAFPAVADLQGISGTVVINVFISEIGKVDDITVSRAEPAGIFEESAITALRVAEFTPAIKNRKAVKSLVVLEITFEASRQPDTAIGAP